MKPQEHMQTLASDLAIITRTGEQTSSTASVPACGDWTVEDLLVHLSQIWSFVAKSIKLDQPVDRSAVVRPDDTVSGWASEWHRASAQELLDALGARQPDEPTWAFDLSDVTVAFWMRRMCHEASIHRYDIQAAAGDPQPIERAAAIDGINEVFDYLVPQRKPTVFAGNGETLHLHVTDGEDGGATAGGAAADSAAVGEWFITRTPDGIEVEHKHAKGDVAARGSASQLLLLLWGRISPEQIEVFGDQSQLADWQEKMGF